MKINVELGPCPHDEDPVQVDPNEDYVPAMLAQCRAFRNQLARTYEAAYSRELPITVRLVIISNNHDYGCYHEVAARCDSNDDEACHIAFWLDTNAPALWDDAARAELRC